MGEDDVRLATTLMRVKKLSEGQLEEFIQFHNRRISTGKKYLGDILQERGLITKKALGEFFKENNRIYQEFLKVMLDRGFLTRKQYEDVTADKDSRVSVVFVLEKLGIMTKDNFTKLCANMTAAPRLGDWLVENGKIGKEDLNKALEEQKVTNLEDYLLYNKIVDKKTLDRVKDWLTGV